MHLGAVIGQFQHLLVPDLFQFPGPGGHPGVGGVDSLHVSVDFAPVRAQSGGQCHGGGVAAAPAQRRDVVPLGDALKTGHHHGPSLRQLMSHPSGVDPVNPGPPVARVGQNPRLRPAQTDGILAEVPQRHGQEGARH